MSINKRNYQQLTFSEVVVATHHHSPAILDPAVYLLGKHHTKRRRCGQDNQQHLLLVSGNNISVGCGLLGVLQDREDLDSEEYSENGAIVMCNEEVKEPYLTEPGQEEEDEQDRDLVEREQSVYIQTAAPFCAVCIGVQGAGKSHTMNVILENCMTPTYNNRREFNTNIQPMTGLVLHYDQIESNVCEAVGLYQSNQTLSLIQPSMKVQRMVVLVSPNYYHQRKAFYEGKCEVYPLLFNWSHLTATHLRKLMRLTESDSQLYVSVMLNKLRTYQRRNAIPVFEEFVKDIQSECNASGQSAPLQQVGKDSGSSSSSSSRVGEHNVYY